MIFKAGISKPETAFHLVSIILLTFIIAYPLYRQCVKRPPGSVCVFSYGPWSDYYTYISYIRQGKTHVFPVNQYTTENMPALSTHWFYGVIGRAGSFLELDPIIIFYGSLYLSFLLYYAFAVLLVHYFSLGIYRYIAYFFIFFSGPFPPLLFSLGKASFSFTAIHWWTKMDPYWRHFQIPHHMFGIALMVATVYFLLRFMDEKKWKWCLLATILQAIATQVFPVPGTVVFLSFSLVLLFMAFTSIIRFRLKNVRAVNKKTIGGSLLFILVTLVSIIVTFARLSSLDRFINTLKWEYEMFHYEIEPYTFSNFIYSYGLLILFFILSLPGILTRKRLREIFISICFIMPFILYQVSLTELFHMNKLRMVYTSPYIYGGILATLCIRDLIKKVKRRSIKLALILALAVLLLVNSAFSLKSHWVPWLTTLPIYLHTYPQKPYMDLAKYLDANLSPYTPVFTYYEIGMFLPAFSFIKVFNGHDTATLNGWSKDRITKNFYARKMSEKEAWDLLKNHQIEYVIWDNPNEPYGFLEKIISFDYVGLYKVNAKESST